MHSDIFVTSMTDTDTDLFPSLPHYPKLHPAYIVYDAFTSDSGSSSERSFNSLTPSEQEGLDAALRNLDPEHPETLLELCAALDVDGKRSEVAGRVYAVAVQACNAINKVRQLKPIALCGQCDDELTAAPLVLDPILADPSQGPVPSASGTHPGRRGLGTWQRPALRHVPGAARVVLIPRLGQQRRGRLVDDGRVRASLAATNKGAAGELSALGGLVLRPPDELHGPARERRLLGLGTVQDTQGR